VVFAIDFAEPQTAIYRFSFTASHIRLHDVFSLSSLSKSRFPPSITSSHTTNGDGRLHTHPVGVPLHR